VCHVKEIRSLIGI